MEEGKEAHVIEQWEAKLERNTNNSAPELASFPIRYLSPLGRRSYVIGPQRCVARRHRPTSQAPNAKPGPDIGQIVGHMIYIVAFIDPRAHRSAFRAAAPLLLTDRCRPKPPSLPPRSGRVEQVISSPYINLSPRQTSNLIFGQVRATPTQLHPTTLRHYGRY